ncbi:MAG: hypothetical protein E6Q76_14515 [Rhizobium sp.]|nr:MAG: hypothetical protein E6Q76_14515 [Rhizobium sp.]
MKKYLLLPLVISLLVVAIVYHRQAGRKPSQADLDQAQQAADAAAAEVLKLSLTPALRPLPAEWKKSVDILSSCGVDWSILEGPAANSGSQDLNLYNGPAKAWHGAMKATMPEHLLACASYLVNHTSTVIDQVLMTPQGSAITFSVLGVEAPL